MMNMMRYFTLISLGLVSASVSALPAEPSSVISQSELMRVVTGLLLVLCIIVLLSWVVKRLNGVNLSSSKGFQSIATFTLGPKEKVMLLRAGGRYFLMGVGTGNVTLIHDFGEQLPQGFDIENKSSFGDILKSARKKQ